MVQHHCIPCERTSQKIARDYNDDEMLLRIVSQRGLPVAARQGKHYIKYGTTKLQSNYKKFFILRSLKGIIIF